MAQFESFWNDIFAFPTIDIDLESRFGKTENVNLYHVAKFSLNMCFTVHYFYSNISIASVLSITIVLDCFKLHVF